MELFGALQNWASDLAAPKWQQKWLQAKWLCYPLLGMWLLIGMLDMPLTYRNDEVKDYQKAEARRLVAGGINAGNQSQALELLLKIASDYEVRYNRLTARCKILGIFWAWSSSVSRRAYLAHAFYWFLEGSTAGEVVAILGKTPHFYNSLSRLDVNYPSLDSPLVQSCPSTLVTAPAVLY